MANPLRKLYRVVTCNCCGHTYTSPVGICPSCGNQQELPRLTPIHIGPRRGLSVWKKAEKMVEADMQKKGISQYRCSKATDGLPQIEYKNGSKFNAGPIRDKVAAVPPGVRASEYQQFIPKAPVGKIGWNSDSGPAPGSIAPPPVPMKMPTPKFNVLYNG